MRDPMEIHAREVEQYRNYVRNKYKDFLQSDRLEAMMVDLFAMMYVGMVIIPNSNKE